MILTWIISLTLIISLVLTTAKLTLNSHCNASFFKEAFVNATRRSIGAKPISGVDCQNFNKLQIRRQLIHLTQFTNKRGSIELFGVLCLFLAISLLTFLTTSLRANYHQMVSRGDAYLCLKKASKEIRTNIKIIGNLNRAIFAAQSLKFIPTPNGTLTSEAFINIAQKGQELEMARYLLKTSMIKECSKVVRLTLAKSTPYQLIGGHLARGITGLATIRNHHWNIYIPLSERGGKTLKLKTTLLKELDQNARIEATELSSLEVVSSL